jgi:hypothetical protein
MTELIDIEKKNNQKINLDEIIAEVSKKRY